MALTEKKLDELMKERGYSKSFVSKDGNNDTIAVCYICSFQDSKRFPVPAYSCMVTLSNEEFEFTYTLNDSILKLVSPKCSPVSMENHFNNIAIKFEHAISILHKYC